MKCTVPFDLGPIRRARVSKPNSLTCIAACLLREMVHISPAVRSKLQWHLLSLQLCKHHLSHISVA